MIERDKNTLSSIVDRNDRYLHGRGHKLDAFPPPASRAAHDRALLIDYIYQLQEALRRCAPDVSERAISDARRSSGI